MEFLPFKETIICLNSEFFDELINNTLLNLNECGIKSIFVATLVVVFGTNGKILLCEIYHFCLPATFRYLLKSPKKYSPYRTKKQL